MIRLCLFGCNRFSPFRYEQKMSIPESNTATQEVMTVEQDWIDVYIKNDAEAFDDFLTDDFLYTSPVGEVVDRATYLKNLAEKQVQMEYIKPSDMLIRIHENTAIVTATWDVKETYKGKLDQGLNRIIRVWLRQPDRWRAVAFQVTSIPH